MENKNHQWIKIEDNIATIGIDEQTAKQVKEFVFIKLPEVGSIKEGDDYITLEAVKWSGHLQSPVTGEIIEVNKGLFNELGKINEDPLNTWIVKVKLQ